MSGRALAKIFETQAEWSVRLGSPFYAVVLTVLAENLTQEGALYALLKDWPGDPVDDVVQLRTTGFLNHLVRQGQAPALEPFWSDANADQTALGAAIEEILRARAGEAQTFFSYPVQTNETGRSAVLMPGMLEIAKATGLPLALREIGASAGLNMMWDRFYYDYGDHDWGDPQSAVQLDASWDGPVPGLSITPAIHDRRGCDINPLDINDPVQVDRALAYIWPDQPERIARFEAALGLAKQAGVVIETASADAWITHELETRPDGAVTVLYHSIMWQYMPASMRAAINHTMNEHGAAATAEKPLAWLAFEPPDAKSMPELRLTLWPGGTTRRLAYCHPHGKDLKWTDDLL